ncbi:MAG TPA: zinc-dependent metalloprotease [Flavobacterium sp.]
MKKLLLFSAIAFSTGLLAQNLKPLASQIKLLHNINAPFQQYDLFSKIDNTLGKYSGTLSSYTSARLNLGALQTVVEERPYTLKIEIPYNNQTITVDLFQKDITTADFKVQTLQGYYNGYQQGIYYRGIIAGDNASLVTFSFFGDKVSGAISSATYGDINVGKLTTAGNMDSYIIYSTQNLLVDTSLKCDTPASLPKPGDPESRSTNSPSETTKCVRMYYEIDFGCYNSHGGNMTQVLDWMTTVHNNVSAVYANDGISNMPASEIFVWTTPEPYEDTGMGVSRLDEFVRRRFSFNGDLANFITTQAGGGFAWGLNFTCNALHGDYFSNVTGYGPYEVSLGSDNIWEFPVYTTTVRTIAHEVGHLLGSPHTHECAWNGNNTQIDDCGNTALGVGGPCFDPANPIIPADGTGTIMGYCATLAAGFGPQPSQLIINTIENATCFGTDCISSCTPSIASLEFTEVGMTSAKMTIVDDNPNATSWLFRVVPGEFVTITSNPFVIQGLQPHTTYQVEVHQICDAPLTATYVYKGNIHMSGVFCDEVISDYDYQQRTYGYQTSLYPATASQKVSIAFDYINTLPNTEGLYVYNGPDIDSPVLAYFTGSVNNPPNVVSTHPTGALTLKLVTNDGYSNYLEEGFYGTVTCVAGLATPEFHTSTTQFSPNPVIDNLSFNSSETIQLVTITDMLGRVVQSRKIGLNSGSVDMSDLSSGHYLAIINFTDRVEIAKLIKK